LFLVTAVEEICPNVYQHLTIRKVEQGVETCTENTGLDLECRLPYFLAHKMHQPIRCKVIFSLDILEKIMMNVF
jgi:hypothetical protein